MSTLECVLHAAVEADELDGLRSLLTAITGAPVGWGEGGGVRRSGDDSGRAAPLPSIPPPLPC